MCNTVTPSWSVTVKTRHFFSMLWDPRNYFFFCKMDKIFSDLSNSCLGAVSAFWSVVKGKTELLGSVNFDSEALFYPENLT